MDFGGKVEPVWISHPVFVVMAKYHLPQAAAQLLQGSGTPLLLQDTSVAEIEEAIEEEITSPGTLVATQRNADNELVAVPASTCEGRARMHKSDLKILAKANLLNKNMHPMYWVQKAEENPLHLMKALALAHHFPIFDGNRPISKFEYHEGLHQDEMHGLCIGRTTG